MSDQHINCSECGASFVFSESERQFYETKGLSGPPKRCKTCRAARKAADPGRSGGFRQCSQQASAEQGPARDGRRGGAGSAGLQRRAAATIGRAACGLQAPARQDGGGAWVETLPSRRSGAVRCPRTAGAEASQLGHLAAVASATGRQVVASAGDRHEGSRTVGRLAQGAAMTQTASATALADGRLRSVHPDAEARKERPSFADAGARRAEPR